MTGYQPLRSAAAWLDLSDRGTILAAGEDRARLLHALTTNNVQQLTPGTGCYAFFLNAQGRILADVNLLCRGDDFVLDVEPETRHSLYQHLDKYIIADDVTLEDATERTAKIAVEGPASRAVLAALGLPIPEQEFTHEALNSRMVARLSSTGEPGFRLFVPASEKAEWIGRLETAGALAADSEAARIFLRGDDGRRAVFGTQELFQSDPYWRDLVPFYEYFHGDHGRGVGASHQTGWTGLVAKLLEQTATQPAAPRA